MMARDREFKLKVYPSLGLSIAWPFIFLLNPAFSMGVTNLAASKLYLAIYAGALITPSVMMMLQYSNQYKAAWIYQITPDFAADAVFKAMAKAVFLRLSLPIFHIDAIAFLWIFGLHILVDLVLVFLAMLFFTVVCFWMTKKGLPFSEPFQTSQQSQAIMGILLMLLIIVLAGIHFVATLIPFGRLAYLVLLLVVTLFSWHFKFRISILPKVKKPKQG